MSDGGVIAGTYASIIYKYILGVYDPISLVSEKHRSLSCEKVASRADVLFDDVFKMTLLLIIIIYIFILINNSFSKLNCINLSIFCTFIFAPNFEFEF